MGLLQIGGLPFCATQPAIHLRQDGRQGGQDLRGLFQGAAEAETRSSVAPATQETCIAAREPQLGAETADLGQLQPGSISNAAPRTLVRTGWPNRRITVEGLYNQRCADAPHSRRRCQTSTRRSLPLIDLPAGVEGAKRGELPDRWEDGEHVA
jgi:hypothetical protein